MSINQTNILFSTRFNFLKILEDYSSSTTITVPTIIPPFDAPAEYLLVTHSLGYAPRARVWYEPISGQLWPMSTEQYSNTDGGPGTPLNVTGDFYLTTSGLYVRVVNVGSPADVKFYWRLYADE